ncbi:MAG: hypothetical protein JO261_14935 [Alphaproteobacteria bacterium]|nr:hypothetical protein [Alphaproteobacteria bacterium]MBV9694991.1 hypothetical protein [Alphaproteobacteria bacterium]
MSIIKALDPSVHARVLPLPGTVLTAIPTREDEERERSRVRLAHLESELRQRDIQLEDLRHEIPQAFEKGRKEGEAVGLRAAEDRQSERLGLLEAALRDAQARLAQSISGLERLAPLLAGECLDLILGERKYRAAMVRKALAVQLKSIEASCVLAIEVSAQDFPEREALQRLKEDIAPRRIAVEVREEMPSGDCRLVLRLGQMEIGLDQQWTALRGSLEAMSMPEAPR